jgi:predicted  nucleic acid-binding Zn-ribbon protein
MKLSKDVAETVLMIAELDQQIAQKAAVLAELESGEALAALRAQLVEASEGYLQASNALAALQQQSDRVQSDLDSVDKRIAHDQKLLAQTSSAKDAEGIGHELKSLAVRKSDLEDAALDLLEQIEVARALADSRLETKSNLSTELLSESESLAANVASARSALSLLNQQRAQKLSAVPVDLAQLYEKKAQRGIAAARLLHRDCGACRIALTATAYDEVAGAPADDLVTCPNCQAILVRW